MRSHGFPSFPDPVVDQNGRGDFASDPNAKTEINSPQALPACGPILNRLPAGGPNSHSVSAADLAALKQFAACMRANGIPQWPDPKGDGTFPIVGTPLESEGKSARVQHGLAACTQYWSGGINAS